jgi:hypothetical protein
VKARFTSHLTSQPSTESKSVTVMSELPVLGNVQSLVRQARTLVQNYELESVAWKNAADRLIRQFESFETARESYALIEYEGETLTLNQSRIVQHNNCKRKYWWVFEENLVPDKPMWALDVGKAAHEGLAALNDGRDRTEVMKAASRSWTKSMAAVKFMPGEKEMAAEHLAKLMHLLNAYINHYEGVDDWVVLKPEVQGRVEVGEGTGCFLIFRTDAIVTWRQRLFLLEHKTMAQNRIDNFLRYQMDYQITAYIYAITKLLKVRVAGVILNALIKTTVPQFKRDMYTRTDEQLAEWEFETVEQIREIMWRKKRVANGENFKMVFYKNTSECFRYGQCPYRQLCLHDTPVTRAGYAKRPTDYVDDPSILETEQAKTDEGGERAVQRALGPAQEAVSDPTASAITVPTLPDRAVDQSPEQGSTAGGERTEPWHDGKRVKWGGLF